MTSSILLCTVGGSHEPILTAIRETRPDHVIFLCTGKDPATGRPGSETQIHGKGNIIKRHPADEKPSLPNIPTQAGLTEAQYEIVIIPADDLGEAFGIIRETLASLPEKFPSAQCLADYTGGTKTMTAALVTAALESDEVELQLVTGSRADLIKVRSGMESATPANVERIRLARKMAPFIAAWRRFAYGEAHQGLTAIEPPRDRQLAARLRTLRDLSRALDAWDRFDHTQAWELIESYRARIAPAIPHLLPAIQTLTTESQKREPMRLFDLWLNAQRRAAQGRHDDAVARGYRFLEWSAQWLLRTRCDIDTADVPLEKIPDGIALSPNREGKRQAGLVAAWGLVGKLTQGKAAEFVAENREKLRDHLQVRNHSILAHGFEPIAAVEWEAFSGWIDSQVVPMLLAEVSDAKRPFKLPEQLPTHPHGL